MDLNSREVKTFSHFLEEMSAPICCVNQTKEQLSASFLSNVLFAFRCDIIPTVADSHSAHPPPSPNPLRPPRGGGAELEVAWGHNLPTAPAGFPEPQRHKWTPGQLGLGTGARPRTQPGQRVSEKET